MQSSWQPRTTITEVNIIQINLPIQCNSPSESQWHFCQNRETHLKIHIKISTKPNNWNNLKMNKAKYTKTKNGAEDLDAYLAGSKSINWINSNYCINQAWYTRWEATGLITSQSELHYTTSSRLVYGKTVTPKQNTEQWGTLAVQESIFKSVCDKRFTSRIYTEISGPRNNTHSNNLFI